MRFKFIFPNLACGEMMKTPQEMDYVLSKGITHILNVQIGCDAQLWYFSELRKKYPNTEFLHLYFSDDKQSKPRWVWDTILTYIHSVLGLHPNNKVYVHCALGESRSPAVIYLLLRQVWFMSQKEAKEALRKKYFKPLGIESKYEDYVEGIENYIGGGE